MRRFELTPESERLAEEWSKEHRKKCLLATYSYTFSPNGIGIGIDMSCNQCGEIRDVTDYDSW
jgi:hypothetical protein